jgi:hypothetical protein
MESGEGLKGTGFWKAVAAIRRDPELAERFSSEVAYIDRRAFEAGVKLRVPAYIGILVLSLGVVAGCVFVIASQWFDEPIRALVFLAGFAILDVAPHSIAHYIVGVVFGMKFTHVFLGGPPPPRPGVKTDYESYLKVPPRKRAIMHASGAVVTKLTPFLLIPVGAAMSVAAWALWGLLAIGFAQILTDVFLSTKTSDWMKVKREWSAHSSAGRG